MGGIDMIPIIKISVALIQIALAACTQVDM